MPTLCKQYIIKKTAEEMLKRLAEERSGTVKPNSKGRLLEDIQKDIEYWQSKKDAAFESAVKMIVDGDKDSSGKCELPIKIVPPDITIY